ncbi:DNA polymerase [Corynebacterium sp. HMSC062E11]|uniref:DNA polymerase n=1 Tax=Corynebacterium sp. HMSC062E11 TaxID=1739326 RepID=UPI001E5BC5B9|nr:DNA polymerase [Corynebacterium sp. HMSC062E11]
MVGLPRSTDGFGIGLTTHGCEISSLVKADVEAALESATGKVKEVLELRSDLAKSSVKKYQAMHNVGDPDGRVRGLIQFYGAGRTGRFVGRLVQVQNLPRNYLPDLDQARALSRQGNLDALELLYDSVADTLSQLIRTAFIPSAGCRFIVVDYSAIEARVIAWHAGETSTLAAFRDGKDLYCETASRMFGVSVENTASTLSCARRGRSPRWPAAITAPSERSRRWVPYGWGWPSTNSNTSSTPGGQPFPTSCDSGRMSSRPHSTPSPPARLFGYATFASLPSPASCSSPCPLVGG